MEFLSLFVVALFPVMKVLLVTLIGLFLALDRINVLGATARSILNHILFYVFSPAMVAAYLADTVTWDSIVEMWFMPVNILLTFILGSALGWILVKISRAPPHQHGLIIGCCAAAVQPLLGLHTGIQMIGLTRLEIFRWMTCKISRHN